VVTPDVDKSSLRFLDAAHVEHPSGTMRGLNVCTPENERLGSLDGVLIEPETRRVRYFVVGGDRPAPDRYVLRADTPAVLDIRDRKLRVTAHAEDLERLRETVADFSDEDAVTAMFRSSAA
jgi:hypothetical protein